MQVNDIEIIIDEDESEDPSLIVKIKTPDGDLDLLGEVEMYDNHIIARRVHIQGGGKGTMGWSKVREIGRLTAEKLDVEYIEIHGAVRSTGANPGRQPRKIRLSSPLKPRL